MKIKEDPNDTLFSLMVRERDNFTCVFCGRSKQSGYKIDNSHYWGRNDKVHRFDPLNCDALCASCHFKHEANKQGFYRDWKIKQIGKELHDKMEKAHYGQTKQYGKYEKKKLNEILKEQYKNKDHLKPDWQVIW